MQKDFRVRLSFPDGVDPKHVYRNTKGFKKSSLCWDCKRPLPVTNQVRICPWMKNCTAVEGWDATRVIRKDPNWSCENEHRVVDTFHVHECPLFIGEEESK